MFHIGVATQHPPLPEPGQLSEMGIDFIRQCLTIDPMARPTAIELMDHPWMLDFREKLENYEKTENAITTSATIPAEGTYEAATVARQAAILQEQETELIAAQSPSLSPIQSPHSSATSVSPGLAELIPDLPPKLSQDSSSVTAAENGSVLGS